MATEQNRVTRDGQAQGQTTNAPRTEEVAVAAYYIRGARIAGDSSWRTGFRRSGNLARSRRCPVRTR